jgi:hypothetical protein
MTDELLRSADPARHLAADPDAAPARRLHEGIVSTRVPMHQLTRVPVIAASIAAAVVAAITALAILVAGSSGPGRGARSTAPAGFAIRRVANTVTVSIDVTQLRHPRDLARALARIGVPATVLVGRNATRRACAKFVHLDPSSADPDRPLVFAGDPGSKVWLRLRPDLLPPKGSYVLEIFNGGPAVGAGVAIGAPPTCM